MNPLSMHSDSPTSAYGPALRTFVRIIRSWRWKIVSFCILSLGLTVALHIAVEPEHRATTHVFYLTRGFLSDDMAARLLPLALQSDSSLKEELAHLQDPSRFATQFSSPARNFLSISATSSDAAIARKVAQYYSDHILGILEGIVQKLVMDKSIILQRGMRKDSEIASVESSLYSILRAQPDLLPHSEQYWAMYMTLLLSGHSSQSDEQHIKPFRFDRQHEARADPNLRPRSQNSEKRTTTAVDPSLELQVKRLTRELAILEYHELRMSVEAAPDTGLSHASIYAIPIGEVMVSQGSGYFSSLLAKLLFVAAVTLIISVLLVLIFESLTIGSQ